MQIKIISLKGREFDGSATGVVLQTTAGEITLLDNHLPIISVLKAGDITIINKAERKKIRTEGGFLEFSKNGELTVLAD